ncbi:hypothetical protein GCM10007049_14930 [Echinicola pacifica]|uniref:Histidine kinase/HSP90-like ATPase domain-containing protein n=1 Tax=Echinicola pacifica TaxID=346377 RepID=A0A918PUC7_9BACT|nr:ATP-binding protein [Echinicola pacifica]GGZ23073.1 hypothetical protein GCM10007049_14930 [Echinicola pacifica]
MNHELRLYCEKNKLADLRSFLERELAHANLSDIQVHELTLAVEEVCANRIIHTHGCDPKSHLYVKVLTLTDRITFEITDSGESFDILKYDEPDLREVIKSKRKGGLGIKLVKRIMDKIETGQDQSLYTCKLTKLLKSK